MEIRDGHSPQFTLRQLEIFIAVARAGSITRAAAELNCSASAASSGVTELERALHTRLCTRKKSQGVTLTPSGRLLARRAEQLLADASLIREALDESSAQLSGVLRIGSYATLAASFLPPLLEEFTSAHPQVSVELHEASQDTLARQVLRGELDAALLYDPTEVYDFVLTHLLSRRPYVLVPADHPLVGRTSVDLRELVDEPLVLLDLPPSKQFSLRWFQDAGLTPRVAWQTHDLDMVRALVAHGFGYAVMLQRQHDPHALDGTPLGMLELDPAPQPVRVHIAHRGRHLPRRTAAFLDVCRRRLADPPAWTGAVAASPQT